MTNQWEKFEQCRILLEPVIKIQQDQKRGGIEPLQYVETLVHRIHSGGKLRI